MVRRDTGGDEAAMDQSDTGSGPHAIPVRLNLVLAGGLIALHAVALVALPLVLLPRSPLWGLLLVLPVLATPALWALVHEAIHGSLHPVRARNDRLGRWLAGVFGTPFQLVRLGHLMHHRFSRSPLNRIEVVESPTPSPGERAAYYGRLFGGLYLGELAASALAILPERTYRALIRIGFAETLEDGRSMWPAAERQLLAQPGRGRMRREGLAITAGLGLAFVAFGEHWWMLALAIAGRAVAVSLHDNVYHYGTILDEAREGSDLRLPRALAAAMLNFNYHGTHHQRPHVPWTGLPASFAGMGRRYAGGWGAALARQVEGPLWEGGLKRGGRGGKGAGTGD
jgi:fatty acid desaturase